MPAPPLTPPWELPGTFKRKIERGPDDPPAENPAASEIDFQAWVRSCLKLPWGTDR